MVTIPAWELWSVLILVSAFVRQRSYPTRDCHRKNPPAPNAAMPREKREDHQPIASTKQIAPEKSIARKPTNSRTHPKPSASLFDDIALESDRRVSNDV